jgi:hypothetical protein
LTPLIIPPDINTWPRKKQVEYYLDCLGWRIHPLYGPNDPYAERPGKQPKLTEEQRLALTRDDVLRIFANGTPDNVGKVPFAPHITLDLDDQGEGASLEFFLRINPEWAQRPHVRSSARGTHFHALCPDLPPGVKKLKSENFLPKLNAELFADPAYNVVLPPSVHVSGSRYQWVGSGPLPVVNWASLCETFRFAVEPKTKTVSLAWMRQYKGDLRSLNLVGLCKHLGVYREELGDE